MMFHRRTAICFSFIAATLALLLAALGPRAVRADGPSAEELRAIDDLQRQMDGVKLRRENVKLAAVVDEVATRTAELRGLKLLRPIKQSTLTREKTKEVIRHALERELPEDKARAQARALWLLGAIPKRDTDLRALYLGLLGEQVAGLYDDETGQLYISAVFGADSNLAKVILAHEITHALQDQHYDLKNSPIHDKTNDDRALAALSVIEGDATLVMMEYLFANLSLAWLKDLPRAMQLDQKQLNAAPPFFQYLLVFPYIEGMQLLLSAEGGHSLARNLLLERAPRSTEQVLHPERLYTSPADEPVTVTISEEALRVRGLKPGFKRVYENTMGEAGIRAILLDPAKPLNFSYTSTKPLDVPRDLAAAAEGWGGDRFALYTSGADPDSSLLVWETQWDSEEDAAEFVEFLELTALPRRFERGQQLTAPKPTQPQEAIWQERGLPRGQGRWAAVGHSGKVVEVRFVEGEPLDHNEAINR